MFSGMYKFFYFVFIVAVISGCANKEVTYNHSNMQSEKFHSIDYDELFKIVSGTTLVASHPVLCSHESTEPCKMIAVLDEAEDIRHFAGVKNNALVANFEENKLIKATWGVYAIGLVYLHFDFGLTNLPINHNRYPFRKIVSINDKQDTIRIDVNYNKKKKYKTVVGGIVGNFGEGLASMAKDFGKSLGVEMKSSNKEPINPLYIKIIRGKNDYYKNLLYSKKMNIKDLRNVKTFAEILGGYVENSLKSVKLDKKSEALGRCYNIKDEDMKKSCMANVKHEMGWCYGIEDEDMKKSCMANAKHEMGWCYGIEDEDIKNSCFANVKKEIGWCYNIKNEDIKNSCISNVKHEKGWCYNIKNEDIKDSCLANFLVY